MSTSYHYAQCPLCGDNVTVQQVRTPTWWFQDHRCLTFRGRRSEDRDWCPRSATAAANFEGESYKILECDSPVPPLPPAEVGRGPTKSM